MGNLMDLTLPSSASRSSGKKSRRITVLSASYQWPYLRRLILYQKKKWKSLGLNGADDNTFELIKDYLTNLRQQVRLEDQFSNWQGIAAGIPQGNVLGPLIFNIFMNDHVHVIKHSSLSAYGDDKHVLYRYTYVCCLPW